jgi:hypothetical protein
MPNAETVPKKQIKPIPQGSWRLGDWVSDSWGIGVIGFFCTVSEFALPGLVLLVSS